MSRRPLHRLAPLALALALGSLGWPSGAPSAAPRLPGATTLHAGAEALDGLPGLAPRVDDVSVAARRLGLGEDWLLQRLETALARDSIARLELSDARSDERMPVLVLRLELAPLPDRLAAAWHLSLAVHRRVRPVAGEGEFLARTWEAGDALAVTSHRGLRASVGASLDHQVAELAAAWRRRSVPSGSRSAADRE